MLFRSILKFQRSKGGLSLRFVRGVYVDDFLVFSVKERAKCPLVDLVGVSRVVSDRFCQGVVSDRFPQI